MTISQELPVSAEYQEASIRFRWAWLEYIDKEKEVKSEIVFMVKILEDEGFSRTKAIEKIRDDHKDLKGFSQATIYRQLPDNMKEPHSIRDLKKYREQEESEDVTNKPSSFSNEKQESINIPTAYDVKNTEFVQDTVNDVYDTVNSEDDEEQEPPLLVVDLPPPEPELQNPKITAFVGKLPKSVLRLAEKIELSPTKLELITNYSNKSILKDHRQQQEKLVKRIAPLTIDQAKIEISQAIRDLETGALQKVKGTNNYIYNGDKRDKIDAKTKIVKSSIMIYLDLMPKMNELMELLTGHKLTRDEEYPYYTEEHVQYTEKHRIDLLKSLDENQVLILMQKLLTAISAMSNMIDIIKQEELIKTDDE
jgi:hypothetical protein